MMKLSLKPAAIFRHYSLRRSWRCDDGPFYDFCCFPYARLHTTVNYAFVDRPQAHSIIGYWHHTVVCLSVSLSVTLCAVAKRYIPQDLHQKCLKKRIGAACQRNTTLLRYVLTPNLSLQFPHPKITKFYFLSCFVDHVTIWYRLMRIAKILR